MEGKAGESVTGEIGDAGGGISGIGIGVGEEDVLSLLDGCAVEAESEGRGGVISSGVTIRIRAVIGVIRFDREGTGLFDAINKEFEAGVAPSPVGELNWVRSMSKEPAVCSSPSTNSLN